jgi:hypothetical protein
LILFEFYLPGSSSGGGGDGHGGRDDPPVITASSVVVWIGGRERSLLGRMLSRPAPVPAVVVEASRACQAAGAPAPITGVRWVEVSQNG